MVQLEQVKVRGVALDGAVAALRPAHAKDPGRFPHPLRRYFADALDPEGWYPLQDYLDLLKLLAAQMDPAQVKGDPWRAFGVFGAKRDLQSVQDALPAAQQSARAGLFADFMQGQSGLAILIRKGLTLRERYYSRGYYSVVRSGERKVEVTLNDFPLSKELCAVSTGYLTELFRSAKVGAWVERLSCRGDGDANCCWEIRFAEPTDVSSLSSLKSKQ